MGRKTIGIKLPFGNRMLSSHGNRIMMSGRGNGSVLLSKGGPGAASSYQDVDDYIRTVGINPASNRAKQLEGSGFSSRVLSASDSTRGISKSLSRNLQKLNVSNEYKKRPNITM